MRPIDRFSGNLEFTGFIVMVTIGMIAVWAITLYTPGFLWFCICCATLYFCGKWLLAEYRRLRDIRNFRESLESL